VSRAAAEKPSKVRVGMHGGAVVVSSVNVRLRPNASASIPNEAAQAAAWAEEYSGNGGAGRRAIPTRRQVSSAGSSIGTSSRRMCW
jgi:hypothetical protein